jgi:hypothetical protein
VRTCCSRVVGSFAGGGGGAGGASVVLTLRKVLLTHPVKDLLLATAVPVVVLLGSGTVSLLPLLRGDLARVMGGCGRTDRLDAPDTGREGVMLSLSDSSYTCNEWLGVDERVSICECSV